MEFYDRMFGWTADEVGDEGYAMIYRPGYGEHLARSDPGSTSASRVRRRAVVRRRSRLAEPDGGRPVPAGTPAHWGITFAVADADASAERAKELGGTAVTPPFDTEWTRTTILADPDGCVFTASQFTLRASPRGGAAGRDAPYRNRWVEAQMGERNPRVQLVLAAGPSSP